ncbi:type II toxin-antitoxin system VapC family toxin [Salinarimonas chemoclinalis]|uniref:type II toxin-antitoxin system VapC family toxin n=1 Tax=Salinarimonas chemoclinalis TaxID=3241599 RepID=UPI003555D78A
MGRREVASVLLDTHAWAWTFSEEASLSGAARAAIDAATVVYVSAISCFEIGLKARLGKWPEMVPHVASLPTLLTRQGGTVVPVSATIASAAAGLDWAHRDPFDRMIAVTALELRVALITADRAFETLAETGTEVVRIW